MEWLYDAGVIHDMLFSASFSFDSDGISWYCDRLTDQPTDRPFYRDAWMHQKICSGLFMAITGFYLLKNIDFLWVLDATSHLYSWVCPSVGQSVGLLVGWWRFCLKTRKIIIFEQIIVVGGTLDESHVVTSSYNHFIIMRTHHWPYGPCCYLWIFFTSAKFLNLF